MAASESLATGNTGSMAMRQVRHELGYRLLGPSAGEGTFGSVFPVIWKDGPNEVGELAMVKHIPIERPHVGASVQEAREIEITSVLAHDNVVYMLRAIQTPFAIDLIFEQCQCDLRHALRSSMELGPGQQILVQICRGLAYVHGEGIMHRDLKPSNILIQRCPGDNVVAKVADFGLARRVPSMHDADHAPRDDDGMAGHWQHKPEMTTQVTTLGTEPRRCCWRQSSMTPGWTCGPLAVWQWRY